MRFRTIQAGPVMQMPVFLTLFFAPVYVPLDLLEGWIHTVATLNPITVRARDGPRPDLRRRAARGAGVRAGVALVAAFGFWALRGLRSAEAAG